MKKSLSWSLVAVLVAGMHAMALAEGTIDFVRDIRPILNANCTGCHGGVKQAGGVSFVYADQVIDFEGDSGYPVVVPKDVEESELFHRITLPADDSERMPPADEHPEGLSDTEIALIRQWIEEGAHWSGHWSFESPKEPILPPLGEENVAATQIDHFILAKLEAEGLSPSNPAAPNRLLRRLSLDLVGLPPAPEAVEAFSAAYAMDRNAAVANAVDEMLASPAFGEKWSSMWLDLVRYADSRGMGHDRRRSIWPYRDWVVDAFNNDMPFDQFTIRQLAGDLLPDATMDDLIATAAHRNTQTNNEGGTDDEEFRTEAVIDRVNTTWQTWGSITFGCVQCHDHPYEAFQHDEYYEFLAFFNNTADSDLGKDEPLLKVPNDPTQREAAHELDLRIRTLQQDLWTLGSGVVENATWSPLTFDQVKTTNNTVLKTEMVEGRQQFYTEGTIQRGPTYVLEGKPKETEITAFRLHVLPKDPEKALRDSEWGFDISELKLDLIDETGTATPIAFGASVADIPFLPHEPETLFNPDGSRFQAWTRMHHARSITIIPKEAIQTAGGKLSFRIANKAYLLGSFPLVIERGYVEYSTDPALTDFVDSENRTAKFDQLKSLLEERSAIPATAIPVMAERPTDIGRPTHLFARGNFLEKDKAVYAGIPESLPSLAQPENPSRLDMAQWWVSGENPLTARVFVNRIWEQLFGTGLVATLEDFGSSGEKPSHPLLLDYLALRFQNDHAWRMKSIVREIVLSSTYQQSAAATPALTKQDPANRLLARGPRSRLSAEILRDQALAIGGLLSRKVGGPPVHPPIPGGVWQPFEKGDKWETPERGEENRYRRALYTYTKRSIPFPAMATFDAPSREFCNPRRLTSNTPLQALTMLNDEAFAEAAQGLARRMKFETEGDLKEKLAAGYQIATAGSPSAERLHELVTLFNNLEARYKAEPNLKEGLAATPDGAAFTIVAQVILNLDEVLTK
ncbi:MAG: PSD1 and planctomycete cytochrome C domain-containing protein [Verrucomicrobiota bacterium]